MKKPKNTPPNTHIHLPMQSDWPRPTCVVWCTASYVRVPDRDTIPVWRGGGKRSKEGKHSFSLTQKWTQNFYCVECFSVSKKKKDRKKKYQSSMMPVKKTKKNSNSLKAKNHWFRRSSSPSCRKKEFKLRISGHINLEMQFGVKFFFYLTLLPVSKTAQDRLFNK